MPRIPNETPLPKMDKAKRAPVKKSTIVDRNSKDSFPASDPPSFNAGEAVGAPSERETPAPNIKDFENAAKKK